MAWQTNLCTWALLLVAACCVPSAYAEDGTGECLEEPPAVDGGPWRGSCSGKDACFAYCEKPWSGVWKATCTNGKWIISGGCKMVFREHHKGCEGLPPAATGVVWSKRCDGTSYCGVNCMAGYYDGYIYSTCVDGKWSTPVGHCKPKIIQAHQRCWDKPPRAAFAARWGAECSGSEQCAVQCAWGCAGKGYRAKCVNGKWVVSGGCTRSRKWHMF